MKSVLCLLLTSFLLSIPIVARTQDADSKPEVGTIRGKVFDPQGAVVSGADIRATNNKTGVISATKSSDEGAFVIALPFGDYSVLITAPGFAKYHTQVALSMENSQSPHNATMQVALGDIQIDVHMIAVGTGTTVCVVCSYTYFSIPYADLPLIDRDPQQLVMLQPGVTEHKGGVSIGGRRLENKTALLDSFDNRDPATGRFAASMSLDALSEFNSDYTNADTTVSSSYGQNNAPLLSAASKSGTNAYHAQGLWFAQRSGFSGNNFFANRGGLPPDQTIFDQAAFVFGGHISVPGLFSGKDHAFFFISYDQTRDHETRGEQVIAPLASFVERTSKVQGSLFRSLLSSNRILLASGAGLQDVDGDGSSDVGDAPVRSSSSLARRLSLGRIDVFLHSQFKVNLRYDRDQSHRVTDLNEGAFTPSSPLHVRRKGEFAAMQFVAIPSPTSINEFRLAYTTNRSVLDGAGSDVPQVIAVNSPLGVGGGIPELPEQRKHRAWIIGDMFHHIKGSHSISFGADVVTRKELYTTEGLSEGRIYYSDVFALATDGALAAGDPLRSIVRAELLESAEFDRRHFVDFNAFANDNWRAGPRLVINYGTSYNFYSGAAYGGQTDRNNFAPFASFAFGPTRSESIILRGGASMLYIPPARLPYGEVKATPLYPVAIGFARPDEIAGSPLPRMWTDRNGALEIESEYSQKIRTAYTESAFFFVQNSIDNKLIIETGYAGTFGHKLNHAYRPDRVSLASSFASPDSPSSDEEQVVIAPDANSSYHSMQLKVTSRERRRLTFQAHYTFAKAIDSASDDRPSMFRSLRLGPVHENNPALERGPSDFDRRHRVVGFFLWRGPELDRLRSRFRRILGDWQLSGIVTLQSGPPVTLYSGGDSFSGLGDFNRDGVLNDRLAHSGAGSINDSVRSHTSAADGYFDASLFTKPGAGSEELGRNVLRGPGYGSVDVAVQKKFSITEDQRVEIRVYGFNVTNRVNFAPPISDLVNADFGRSVEAGRPRTIRFALRYSF